MKILVKENRKLKVFVQIQDLLYLQKMNINIPITIQEKIDNDKLKEKNVYDYVEFNKPYEIAFFNNYDFIPNYADYENLTLENIYDKAEEIGTELKKIKDIYDKCNEEEKKEYSDYVNNLEYKLNSIAFIHSIKKRMNEKNIVKTKQRKRSI